MDNDNIEKLTRELMADSKLNLSDPLFDERVLRQISVEYERKKRKQQLLSFILVFCGIEFIMFAIAWFLLLYYPGYEYFVNTVSDSLQIFKKIGYLVIQYDYIIFSFIVVGILDLITNRKVRFSLN